MDIEIRRASTIVETQFQDAGRVATAPLTKVAVVLVLANPYVGRYVEDLSPLIEASPALGRTMAERLQLALAGAAVEGYGKAGLVGTGGEKEHANALLTTAFANPFRDVIGGEAWISSVTKVAAPGTLVDIPMNATADVYVRSHYDAMSLVLPDAPLPDEVALIFCVSTGGRLNARVGGLTLEEARAPVGGVASLTGPAPAVRPSRLRVELDPKRRQGRPELVRVHSRRHPTSCGCRRCAGTI